jgi:hypothetical protein
MSSGSIEDRLAIRELVETFTVGVMRGDVEIWASTWADDGVWMLPSMKEPVRGIANLRTAFSVKTGYAKFIGMVQFPADLVIEGNKARGRPHGVELIFKKVGGLKLAVGYFDDEYVKKDGRWYFTSRSFNVLGLDDPK